MQSSNMTAHTIPHNSSIPQQKVKVKFQKSQFAEKDWQRKISNLRCISESTIKRIKERREIRLPSKFRWYGVLKLVHTTHIIKTRKSMIINGKGNKVIVEIIWF